MPDSVAVLRAVGDVTLGDHPLCPGFGARSRFSHVATSLPFQHVSSLLRSADVAFANVECTLSLAGVQPRDYSTLQMRGIPEFATVIRDAGVTVVNVANNHSMQHGAAAFEESARLMEHAGLRICGLREAESARSALRLVDAGALRVGFLGYSLRPRQYFDGEPLYCEGRQQAMLEDVVRSRDACDVLAVSLHWGDEFITRPAPDERRLARALVDAGATLVIGHHPHVLRGIERYRQGLIAYSLGNFVCDMLWDESLRESAVLECTVARGVVRDARMIPVRIDDDYRPVPLVGSEADDLLRRISAMSAELECTEPSDDAAYAADADAALQRIRRASRAYFLRNARRAPPRFVAQQLLAFLANRLRRVQPERPAC